MATISRVLLRRTNESASPISSVHGTKRTNVLRLSMAFGSTSMLAMPC